MTLVAWSCLWCTQILIADPLGQTVDLGNEIHYDHNNNNAAHGGQYAH